MIAVRKMAVFAGATLLPLGVQCAAAQENAAATEALSQGLEEIVVSARRREERLQDAPLAVTAFSDGAIQQKSIFNVAEVARFTPNLSISSGRAGHSVGYVFIRGIGQSDDNPSMDPGVAQYVDDVYLGRVQGGLIDLNSVRSIEVLRGPQGTLYGKNTIGGAIKINSLLPGNDPDYFVQASSGNYDEVSLSAATSQPLVTDQLAIRLATKYTRNDGYLTNNFDGDRLNDTDVLSGRVMLRYTPTAELEALLSIDGSRDRSNPSAGRLVATANTPVFGLVNGFIGPIGSHVVQAGADPYRTAGFDVQHDPYLPFSRSEENTAGTSLTVTWSPGPLTVKSITAYRGQDGQVLKDVDSTPLRVAHAADRMRQRQFSEELQFSGESQGGRLNWLAGLFYYDEDVAFDTTNDLVPALIPLGINQQAFRNVDLDTSSYAAFLNVGVDFSERLSMTLGGRYTREEKSIDTVVSRLSDAAVTFGPATNSTTFDDFSPKAELDYKPAEDVLVYVSAAKGFKSGGFNGRAGVGAQLEAFQPEEAWTYELGLKSSWLDRRLTANVATFYTDYQDIQFQVFTAVGNQLLQLVTNAAKGHVQGLEVEAALRPIGGLTLSGSLGLTDAGFKRFMDARLGDLSNNQFQNAPETSYTFSTEYERQLGSDLLGVLAVDYSHRSRTYFDPQNTTSLVQDAYGIWNARLAFRFDEERLELAAYGKNLADKRYLQNGASLLDSFGFAIGYYGAPRTYGLQLTYRY